MSNDIDLVFATLWNTSPMTCVKKLKWNGTEPSQSLYLYTVRLAGDTAGATCAIALDRLPTSTSYFF